MNDIVIHGRLAREPEIKSYTNAKGEQGNLCNFTVAVNRSRGEEADFFNCRVFGKRAEVIHKFFRKGSEIVVRGEMQCQVYEDKDGNKRYPWVLMMQEFDFCGSKKDNDSTPAAEAPSDSFEEIDEDVPF